VLSRRSCSADDEGDDEEQNLFMMKFEHHVLETVSLQGIKHVTKVFMRKEEATVVDPDEPLNGFVKQKEWLLDSEGINLPEVLQARPCLPAPCHLPGALCSGSTTPEAVAPWAASRTLALSM
jgi:hypothetical protein